MKRILKIAVGGIAAIILAACTSHVLNSGNRPLPAAPDDGLRVATLNVHYIVLFQETGPWSVGDWEDRKTSLSQAFDHIDADVFGFQEMESFGGRDGGGTNLVLDHLLAEHPDYAAAAVGDWETFPITQPILYRTSKLTLLDQGWFFFSDTPDEIYSRTFNGSWPAYATWAEFKPVQGGAAFRVYNVHYEYRSRSNRRLSAELTVDRMAPAIDAGMPVILMGDMNAMHGAATMDILRTAGVEFGRADGSTYHLNRGINLFGAIDHIGTTDQWVPLGDVVVVRQQFDDRWPTDHYPVVRDFALPVAN